MNSNRSHIIRFKDNISKYQFHLTKHTLYKEFLKIPFDVVNVPSELDLSKITKAVKELIERIDSSEVTLLETKEYVILPLYSTRYKKVSEKSGLNQWNASGRPRHCDEVYIPIPKIVHRKKKGFFPPKDNKFKLITSEGIEFCAKVCQENNKALMSDPNKDLGKWLLRDMLNLRKGELATLNHLIKKNADSVIVYKIDENSYKINLHSFGAFEEEYFVVDE